MKKKKIREPFSLYSEESAHQELTKIATLKAHLITPKDLLYPKDLKMIPDPPPLITIFGNLNILQCPTLGIVGSRTPSREGEMFCHSLSQILGQNGYTVASGFSRGIEGAAHEGALLTGTLSIFPGGVDVVFPKEHQPLFHKILDKGGAILSEMPLGLLPQTTHFLRRYRLISGVSKGVILIEAPNSAVYITTQMALEQGRDVFAVPGRPLDPYSKGTNALIKEGAFLIDHPNDILDFYSSNSLN